MNHKKNKELSANTHNRDNVVSLILIVTISFIIGLNMLRTYKAYTSVQYSDSKSNYNSESAYAADENITLSIDNSAEYPLLEIYVNGKLIRTFDKDKEITIQARNQDVIQINGAMYPGDIQIHVNSKEIGDLRNGQVLVNSQLVTLDPLGK